MYFDDSLDPDVLAISVSGDRSVTFISSPRSVIDGKDYTVVFWDAYSMYIAVAEDYLSRVIDADITKRIQDEFSPDDDYEAVAEMAAELFANRLSMILSDITSEDPRDYVLQNIDLTIRRILDEA